MNETGDNDTREAALVLFSGGQDSATCLFWALHPDFGGFGRVEAVGFRYGQQHVVELRQARRIAEEAGVLFTVYDLAGVLGGSALTEAGADTDRPHVLAPELPAAFVPGRNALFLNVAAAHAYRRGMGSSGSIDLVGGMCQADSSGYPDCRRPFVDAMERALSLAMDVDLEIHTPLMDRTKAETWKLAADLGVLEVIRRETHTDYHGDRSTWNEWGYGRLDNPASRLRAQGYAEAKEKGWV